MSSDTNLLLSIHKSDFDKAGRRYSESVPTADAKDYATSEDGFSKDKLSQLGSVPTQVGPPRKFSGFFASAVNLLKSIIGAGKSSCCSYH